MPDSVSTIGTAISITVCIVVGIGVTATSIGGVTIVVPNTGNVIGVPCTLSSSVARR